MSLPCNPKEAERLRIIVFDEHKQLYSVLKERVTEIVKDYCDKHDKKKDDLNPDNLGATVSKPTEVQAT